jgi:signal transduction histidine kinase
MRTTAKSKRTPDRAETDRSLLTERQNTDLVLEDRKAELEQDADRIVDRARENADAVLLEARDKADEQFNRGQPLAATRVAVNEERKIEDQIVDDARATADEILALEREQLTRELLARLPIERTITDRYLMTERVRSDKAIANRDDFLGIVSHDLRDLLNGIVMTAALLGRRAPKAEEGAPTRDAAERIQRLAARMKRVIGDLVDIAAIDSGKLTIERREGNPAAVIAEAADSFRSAAAEKPLSIIVENSDGAVPVTFDSQRVLQILANLIANSIKFTPPGGSIRVTGARADRAYLISVIDTGPGIPADSLEAVFERFRQLADDDRRGLGLGLYISKCLIEAHGGRIWAESEPGSGTTIRFTLPLDA